MVNKLDFGSGYNPRPGYKTCDNILTPNIDYYYNGVAIVNAADKSIDRIVLRNVIHHIPDFDVLAKEFKRILTNRGTIWIVDCLPQHYMNNVILDYIYYRSVNSRPDIQIFDYFRDYLKTFGRYFKIRKIFTKEEKQWTILSNS